MNLSVQNSGVDHGNDLCGVRTDSPHHLGGVAGLINQISRVHPLGRETQIELLAALQARALLQNRLEQFLRGAGIGGGLQHHNASRLQMARNGPGRIPNVADIRLLMGVQRRGYADGDKIHVLYEGKVGRGPEHSGGYQLPQIRVHHVPDVVLPRVHHVHLFLLDIKADGTKAVLGLVHRQRQTHIAQTADAHEQSLVLNFLNQPIFHSHASASPFTQRVFSSCSYRSPQAGQTARPSSKEIPTPHRHT